MLGLALSVGTVVWFDLRLLGATMRTRPVSEVFRESERLDVRGVRPHVSDRRAAVHGARDEGVRQRYFRAKIALMLLAGVNTAVYHLTIDRRPSGVEQRAGPAAGSPGRRSGFSGVVVFGHSGWSDLRVRPVKPMVWEPLQPFVNWLGEANSGSGSANRRIVSPGCSSMHLVGLTLLLGGTLVVSLRLLDLGLRSQPARATGSRHRSVAHGWTCSDDWSAER